MYNQCVCVCCCAASGQCPIKERERERGCRPTYRSTVGRGPWRCPICRLLIHLLSSGCREEPRANLMEPPPSTLRSFSLSRLPF